MKKILALILVLALSLTLLAGCGGAVDPKPSSDPAPAASQAGSDKPDNNDKTDDTPAGPKEMVIGSINDVGSMYPGGAMTTGRKTMRNLVYEPLFWQDAEAGKLQPVIGKSYESLGNGKYAIEIFDNVYDSEGNHLTADDVLFSVQFHIDDGENPSNYETITEIKKTGDYSFEVTFDPEVKGQFEAFVSYTLCITEAAWNASPDGMTEYPVGTGGYVLNKDETILGSTYVFEKRDDYWQTDAQYITARNANNIDKFTVRVITDTATMAVELQTGGIDFTTDIATVDRANFVGADGNALDGYTMVYGTNNAFAHLSFNCGPASLCSDINLRKAIAYAIDAAACAFTVHGANGKACYAATNPGLGDTDESMGDGDYYNYSVDKAKAALAQSSYKGETLKLLVQPNATIKPAAALIQQYCNEINVKIEVLSFDMAQYRKLENDKSGTGFDIKINGLTAIDDYVFRSLEEIDNRTKSGKNKLFIADAEMQKLYEAAAAAETNNYESVKALLDYVEEQCYIYGLYYGPKVFLGKENVTSVVTCIPEDVLYTGIDMK